MDGKAPTHYKLSDASQVRTPKRYPLSVETLHIKKGDRCDTTNQISHLPQLYNQKKRATSTQRL